MIYDRNNRPVANAAVYVNEKYRASSDINGHFSIPELKPKLSYNVSVQKQNYETITMPVSFSDPSHILYLHILSGDQLLAEAETAIKEKEWGKTESLLYRAEKAGADSLSREYLRAILAYSREEYDDALEILSELILTEKNAPYLYLFIADIYQRNSPNPARAVDYLRRFLELRRDSEVEKRLSELEN
jgi:tetratricopeptide (TPR) repeat protein